MKINFIPALAIGIACLSFLSCEKNLPTDEAAGSGRVAAAGASSPSSSSTAQSVMAVLDVPAVSITEEGTYTFNKETAKTYYTTSQGYNLTIVTGQGATQTAPSAPAPDPISNATVNGDQCVFFSGGKLPDFTYVQTINGTKGWKFRWSYAVTGQTVAAKTAWDYAVSVPGVNPEVPINVTFAGLSALSTTKDGLKYSFSLLDDDGISSRVKDVKITVDGVDYFPAQTISSGVDFQYIQNGDAYGKYPSLLIGTNNEFALSILASDLNTKNDNLSAAVCSKTDQIKPTLGEGEHTIVVTAVIKGNSTIADKPISIEKTLIITGGCN